TVLRPPRAHRTGPDHRRRRCGDRDRARRRAWIARRPPPGTPPQAALVARLRRAAPLGPPPSPPRPPPPKPYYSRDFDPVWAALVANGVQPFFHTQTGGGKGGDPASTTVARVVVRAA